jgi:solute carrier family 35 (UDP-xylose/UDP-N-acetylglucosamine transporter), member B4
VQGKSMSLEHQSSTSEFTTGLALLLLAQLLAAFQGAYIEDTYAMYRAEWTENLFYSHIFSLPMFLPLSGNLRRQYAKLSNTPPLDIQQSMIFAKKVNLPSDVVRAVAGHTPQGVLFLAVNAITQLACISGVNLLAAKSSAVTVTIVLNIRKLVSFIFSTLLFGHHLSWKMILGSALVFGSGALYGWETTWRLPRERQMAARQGQGHSDGSIDKHKQ